MICQRKIIFIYMWYSNLWKIVYRANLKRECNWHPHYVVSKFSQVRVIGAQFVPREPKLVRVIGSFEKSWVREIGGEILELEWSKFNGDKVSFEISGCCYIAIWPLERSIRDSCAPLPSHMDISSRQLPFSLMLSYGVFFTQILKLIAISRGYLAIQIS